MINLTRLADKIRNIKFLNTLDLDSKKIMLIVLASLTVFYLDFNFVFKSLDKITNKINLGLTAKAKIAKASKTTSPIGCHGSILW